MKDWNAVDEKCPHCGSTIKQAKGLNKQNLKKLCLSRPSLQDIIIFIMLALCLLMAYTYYNEVGQYQFIYENPGEFCNKYWSNTPIRGSDKAIEINVSMYKNGG